MADENKGRRNYLLAVKKGDVFHNFYTETELENFMAKYLKYYKRETKTIFANLKIVKGNVGSIIRVSAEELERLEPFERTIGEVDDLTTRCDGPSDIKRWNNYTENPHKPVVIAYKSSGTYKTIPVIYRSKKDLLDYGFLSNTITQACTDDHYFLVALNCYKKFNFDKSMAPYLEQLLIADERYSIIKGAVGSAQEEAARIELQNSIRSFVYAWCNPKDKNKKRKFSYRRLRDLATFAIQNKALEITAPKQISLFDEGHTMKGGK